MATIQEQLDKAKLEAEQISGKVSTLSAAEKQGMATPPEATVQQAESFLLASPNRLPSESIEDFTRRIEGGKAAPAKPEEAPKAVSPAVGTSEAERIKERAQAIKEAFGLGAAPSLPDIFTPADRVRLEAARKERDTIQLESEKILEERLALEDEFRQFKATAGLETTEAGRAGAVSEKGRGIQNRMDALNRRELVVETKLRNRNTIISELMGLERQEYSDAVNQYNNQFSQSLQLYNTIDKDEDEVKTNAKASLDVLAKAYQAQIEAGKFKIESLTAIQKAKIEELEIQAGFPQGVTLATLQALKPTETQLYAGIDSLGNFNVVTKDAKGNISLKRIEGVGQVGLSDDIKEYNFYVQQEKTEGRTPLSFLEYMQRKGKTGTDEDPEIVRDLIDAEKAVEITGDEDAVRRIFLQSHPGKGKQFDDYFQR